MHNTAIIAFQVNEKLRAAAGYSTTGKLRTLPAAFPGKIVQQQLDQLPGSAGTGRQHWEVCDRFLLTPSQCSDKAPGQLSQNCLRTPVEQPQAKLHLLSFMLQLSYDCFLPHSPLCVLQQLQDSESAVGNTPLSSPPRSALTSPREIADAQKQPLIFLSPLHHTTAFQLCSGIKPRFPVRNTAQESGIKMTCIASDEPQENVHREKRAFRDGNVSQLLEQITCSSNSPAISLPSGPSARDLHQMLSLDKLGSVGKDQHAQAEGRY